nr:hypothetical protein [Tanacetum cinerariifolium]
MDCYRDQDIRDIIFGKPLCKASCMKARRFYEFSIIHNGNDNIAYQMARSHPRFKHLSNAQCNKIRPILKVSVHELSIRRIHAHDMTYLADWLPTPHHHHHHYYLSRPSSPSSTLAPHHHLVTKDPQLPATHHHHRHHHHTIFTPSPSLPATTKGAFGLGFNSTKWCVWFVSSTNKGALVDLGTTAGALGFMVRTSRGAFVVLSTKGAFGSHHHHKGAFGYPEHQRLRLVV